MNLTRARLIVRNPAAYPPAKVREAAVWLLGCMTATAEDILEASAVI